MNTPRILRDAPLIVALVGALALAAGCDANCKSVCKKLVDECEYGEPGYGREQCESECQVAIDDLEEAPDATAEREALQVQMDCIVDSECSALLDPEDPGYPACYDPQVSVF